MIWQVYILKCQDGSFYTGSTNNLQERFLEHKNGKGGRYTRSHKVVKLVYTKELPTKSASLKKEAEIKSWTRKKKITLIKSKS